MECAVGSACASLESWRMRVFTRPVERPFFPARVHGVVAAHQAGDAARGLSSKPYAGAVVQGSKPNHPGPSGLPSPEAMPSAFVSPRNQMRVCERLSSLGPAPVGSASLPGSRLLTRRRPRRPPPVHPEAPVDLETSLRTGTSIIAQVWRAPGRLFFVPPVGDSVK